MASAFDSDGLSTYKGCPLLRHCERETLVPVEGTIQGRIPSWLQGQLVRVGPGIRKIGNDQYKHIFDGLAVLHKFQFVDGKVYYQSRALHSDAYRRNVEANRIVISEFGTRANPCETLFGRFKSKFKWLASVFTKGLNHVIEDEITDNCVVNMAYFGDQLYALTEACHMRRVDPSNLEILGEKTTLGHFIAMNTASAHPHVLQDGTVINIGSNFRHSRGPHYCFMKVSPTFNSTETSLANAKLVAEIPSRWKLSPSYFHSFGITNSRKLIFIEAPYCFNLLGMAVGNYFTNKTYCDWLKWYPEEKTRFYVISMNDGQVHPIVYETEKLFVFHHINAYEENDQIIIDVVGYSEAEWITRLGVTKDGNRTGKFTSDSAARRYILPLKIEPSEPGVNLVKSSTSASAVCRPGSDTTVDLKPHYFTDSNKAYELPRINYRFNGMKYRFFYLLGSQTPAETYEEIVMNMITKVDTVTGKSTSWHLEEGHMFEPVFISNPGSEEEDDGVLLTTILFKEEPTAIRLLILNAKDMCAVGSIDFAAAGTVTGTLHGMWAQAGEKIHIY